MKSSLLLSSLILSFASYGGVFSPENFKVERDVQVFSPIKAAPAEHMTLRIYNWEDYIAEDPDVLEEFRSYVLEHDNVDLEIVYDTFDTNESMLSLVEMGAAYNYDLICPSDYMIQRMMSMGLLRPFTSGEERAALYVHNNDQDVWGDNYERYSSIFLQDWFGRITSPIVDEEGNSSIHSLSEYARGYMWGTLGLTYNPTFTTFMERGLSPEDVMVQMDDWGTFYDPLYAQTFQIKDSMRDTYAMTIMEVYSEEFNFLLDAYRENDFHGAPYSEEEYNSDVNTIFNNIVRIDEFRELMERIHGESEETLNITPDSIIDSVELVLRNLKDNSYGLEVDSGKQDIVAGKSGVALSWSGDAVFSMDLGEQEDDVELYYALPETGGNIWFDGWVMLNYPGLNQEYAQKFVDFISRPDIASLNMDYIGYTSFVAGDEILSLVRDWYDARNFATYVYIDEGSYEDGYHDYLYDEDGEKVAQDGTGLRDVEVDGVTYHDVDFGSIDMRGSTLEAPGSSSGYSTWEEYFAGEEIDARPIDLDYFFEGTISSDDAIVYSDEFYEVTGQDINGETKTVTVGRQFYAQYPLESMLPSLAVMEDYGDNNDYVLRMWEAIKADSLDTWVIVVLVLEIAAFVAVFAGLYIGKHHAKKLRKKRRDALKEA